MSNALFAYLAQQGAPRFSPYQAAAGSTTPPSMGKITPGPSGGIGSIANGLMGGFQQGLAAGDKRRLEQEKLKIAQDANKRATETHGINTQLNQITLDQARRNQEYAQQRYGQMGGGQAQAAAEPAFQGDPSVGRFGAHAAGMMGDTGQAPVPAGMQQLPPEDGGPPVVAPPAGAEGRLGLAPENLTAPVAPAQVDAAAQTAAAAPAQQPADPNAILPSGITAQTQSLLDERKAVADQLARDKAHKFAPGIAEGQAKLDDIDKKIKARESADEFLRLGRQEAVKVWFKTERPKFRKAVTDLIPNNRKMEENDNLAIAKGKEILAMLESGVDPRTSPLFSKLLPGSKAGDLQKLVDTLASQEASDNLIQMRQDSPTGGALGNVSDKDIQLLKEARANLSTWQSPEQFRKSIETILSIRLKFQGYRREHMKMMSRLAGANDPREYTKIIQESMNKPDALVSGGGKYKGYGSPKFSTGADVKAALKAGNIKYGDRIMVNGREVTVRRPN